MTLRIVIGKELVARYAERGNLGIAFKSADCLIQSSVPAVVDCERAGRRSFLFGKVWGVRGADGTKPPVGLAELVAGSENVPLIEALDARCAVIRVSGDQVSVFLDAFAQMDLYVAKFGNGIVLATGLDLIDGVGSTADTIGFAHALTVYGGRPAKKHTLRAGVTRLGVREILTASSSGVRVETVPFRPAPQRSYESPKDLKHYADLFLDAIERRSAPTDNVVLLSSGWDSTGILAGLVKVRGAKNVRAVIGRMNYSERSGIFNQFEIDRARKFADYYGIRMDICEFDYCKGVDEDLEVIRTSLARRELASITAVNHARLLRHVAKGGAEAVFAGECSDAAHNLGFSQYVTMFHPSLGFREYADKMASYVFGPTFLQRLHDGSWREDQPFKILTDGMAADQFEVAAGSASDINRLFLSSFFLRPTRLPLMSLKHWGPLSDEGRARYLAAMEGTYLDEAAQSIDAANHYQTFLHLYHSFHWQGATVAPLGLLAEDHGLTMALPYRDPAVLEFLGNMPEEWGRGLDLHPTKYPLKWMLENVLDYPFDYQKGYHSYLYDVNPQWNIPRELMFHSAFTEPFRKALSSRAYREWLDASVFRMDYIEAMVDRCINDGEASNQDLSVLFTLSLISLQR